MIAMDAPRRAVIIFRSDKGPRCREAALVLRSVGIEHVVQRNSGIWFIAVPAERAATAVDELRAYAHETADWNPREPIELPKHRIGVIGVVTSIIILFAVGGAATNWVFGYDWFSAGKVNTSLMRSGEWWRAVTALTLHVDAAHLLGNIILGSIFALLAGRLFGNGLAWFSIVLGGTFGNVVSALVQQPNHTAVGASTAVFATLGLVGGYVWRRRQEMHGRWALRWAPIIVAALFLAYTGSGGARTDVISHLTGFLVGIALGGGYASFLAGHPFGRRAQWIFGTATIALVALAWTIALLTNG